MAEMKASTKKQIKSGLRIGGAIGSFMSAVILGSLGISLSGESDAASVAIAWLLVGVAAILLMLSARYATLLLCGYLLFALIKLPFVLISGHNFDNPAAPISRTEFGQLAIFAIVSLCLLYRPADKKPTLIERIGFAVYVVCFFRSLASQHFSLVSFWTVGAIAVLFVVWLDRKQKGHWNRLLPFKEHHEVKAAALRSLDA